MSENEPNITKHQPFDANNIAPSNFEGFVTALPKTEPVSAIQLNYPEGFFFDTPHGRVRGLPGYFLVINSQGEKHVFSPSLFTKSYDIKRK